MDLDRGAKGGGLSTLADTFRDSDDAKTDSSDELSSPTSGPKEKRKLSLEPEAEESDDSSSNAGPRQRRHAVKAVVKEKTELITVKVPASQVKTYIKSEAVVERYFAHCYQVRQLPSLSVPLSLTTSPSLFSQRSLVPSKYSTSAIC